jgi:hypothetical protein
MYSTFSLSICEYLSVVNSAAINMAVVLVGGGEGRKETKVRNMVDGLHLPI